MSVMACQMSDAQTKAFRLGQWTEIYNSVIKELNRSYVDSLPVDRIMRAGVDAMLEEPDWTSTMLLPTMAKRYPNTHFCFLSHTK